MSKNTFKFRIGRGKGISSGDSKCAFFVFILAVVAVLSIVDQMLMSYLNLSIGQSLHIYAYAKRQEARPHSPLRGSVQSDDIAFVGGNKQNLTFQAGTAIEESYWPEDYHCHHERIVCERELHAHPEWQQEVLEAIHHSWDGYANGPAFGHDAVDVKTGGIGKPWVNAGVFMIDALSTLYLAGLHDEFKRCVSHIEKLDWSQAHHGRDSFFEITIRLLGGLLSAYDLSGEPVLLEKATELGNRLLRSFTSADNPFPEPSIDLVTGQTGWDWNGR